MNLPEYGNNDGPFGPNEEKGIVSLFLDFPEFYISLADIISPDLFQTVEAKFIISAISQDYEKRSVIPTRPLLRDKLSKILQVDDPYEQILGLVDRPSDPREVPFIKDALHKWAEYSIFNSIYSDDAIDAHARGDYEHVREIINKADRLKNAGAAGFWLYEQLDDVFVADSVEHFSTGFPSLDAVLNNGGPSRKEVVMWMAPTGVGKSCLLCNNAFVSSRRGLNVLFVTFELSDIKSAARMLAAMSSVAMDDFLITNIDEASNDKIEKTKQIQENIKAKVASMKTKGDIAIYELPPDECSVDQIYSIIDSNKKMRGWTPDVVVIDYLELMISRRKSNNDSDYTRQKSVATEVRGLAKNENVLVFTATQTNRSSMENKKSEDGAFNTHITLDKSAESFGKNMPVDYVVSLNQTEEEYNMGQNGGPAIIRLFVAKNRNGQKFKSVHTNIWYDRMQINEVR